MKYSARKFVKESYDKNDNLAKKIFIKFIKKKGYNIINSKENYQHDIVAEKDNVVHYFELEVKNNYPFRDRKSFPFETVSFLGRKKRLHEINPFFYVIICTETNCALTAFSEDIFDNNYVEEFKIQTQHRNGLDQFYRIPKELCSFFYIGN